jgi:hypothetical protein
MKDQLGDAIAIPQMNEEHAAEIAPAMHPTHQQGGLASVGGAQLAAGVGAAQFAQEI